MHSGLPETFPGEALKAVHSGKSSSPEKSKMVGHALAGDNGPELLSPLFRGLSLQRTGHLSHWGPFSPGQCWMNVSQPQLFRVLPDSPGTFVLYLTPQVHREMLKQNCRLSSLLQGTFLICRAETYKYPALRDPHMT